jgi:hypothetical protein
VEWTTAGWLILAAVMVCLQRKFIKIYLVSEIVLAAPTAYYICILAVRHGGDFAPGFKDLILTIVLFTIFSLAPIALALRQTRLPARLRA